MATLHLPKKRPIRNDDQPRQKVRRALDEGLQETVPETVPGSETDPGSAEEALVRKPERATDRTHSR